MQNYWVDPRCTRRVRARACTRDSEWLTQAGLRVADRDNNPVSHSSGSTNPTTQPPLDPLPARITYIPRYILTATSNNTSLDPNNPSPPISANTPFPTQNTDISDRRAPVTSIDPESQPLPGLPPAPYHTPHGAP